MNDEKNLWFSITKDDIDIDWFSGTGGGGQHRNKHQNCCRLTHKKTGIVAKSQSYRERQANFKKAFKTLAERVVSYYLSLEDNDKEISNERVRTYHEPRNIVIDHASGKTSTYKKVVKDGDISEMVEARLQELSAELFGKNDT